MSTTLAASPGSSSSRKRKHDPGCPCLSCFDPQRRCSPRSSTSATAGDGCSSASTIVADTETVSHELTISGYSGTKGLGVGEAICSDEFTAGGHHWRILYYPDGVIKEEAGWIAFLLLRVDDDDHAVSTVNVRADVEFSLLDQNGQPVQPFVLSEQVTFENCEAVGSHFIQQDVLESSPHLKDDCFRVSCKVTVIKLRAETSQVQFRAAPSSDLHCHLYDLLDSKMGADIKFKIGEETFSAHRSVLAARSSVFKAELFGSKKEKKASCVCINNMEAWVFKAMLQFIYTDSLPEMEERDSGIMAQNLLVAADRYELKRLKTICEDMLSNFIDINTAATTLALAEQHGCHRLKEACFRFLKSPGNMKAVMETDGFEHLMTTCPSILRKLLAEVAP